MILPGAHIVAQQRLLIEVRGAVQGVGFRPFIYRLATSLGLNGFVRNTGEGVTIEVEGVPDVLQEFLLRLPAELPAPAILHGMEPTFLDPVGFSTFSIEESAGGRARTLVLPDIATCPACLAELFDPDDRRFLYPFTNCTHCGPRYTIIESLPYDRANTSMHHFGMCDACRAEYEDPLNRRFHAQPNACPECGPQLGLLDHGGELLASRHDALLQAAEALRAGAVVAVKGLGGFHLMVDARSEEAVKRLRRRKHREEKPFALMVPSLEAAADLCHVSPLEERLLQSPESPIVLLSIRGRSINPALAPGNPNLGIMLPYTPLHHVLMRELGFPVVATSGNRAEEPICTDTPCALERLGDIADLFLVHDRPIVRHVDDSVVRVVMDREMVLRRARGYAPLPVRIPGADENTPVTLAVGPHLKNTVALSVGDRAFLSQHIGDLETAAALEAFERVGRDLQRLYETSADQIACDLHPDYLSTGFARRSGLPVVPVQHHYAHVLACMAENQVGPPLLGVSWDGTGYGPDETIWGGEFLSVTEDGYERIAHLRAFPLPGGDAAVREPRRSAAALLHDAFGEDVLTRDDCMLRDQFEPESWVLLLQMLRHRVHTPLTSSAGRLFDGVAALLGLCPRSSYEGQAAMALEFAATGGKEIPEYHIDLLQNNNTLELDWRPAIRAIYADVLSGVPAGKIAGAFHGCLAGAIVQVARHAGLERVALTGGCFQNNRLTSITISGLRKEGFRPYWHQRIPPNDGGIALGQVVAACRTKRNEKPCASPYQAELSA